MSCRYTLHPVDCCGQRVRLVFSASSCNAAERTCLGQNAFRMTLATSLMAWSGTSHYLCTDCRGYTTQTWPCQIAAHAALALYQSKDAHLEVHVAIRLDGAAIGEVDFRSDDSVNRICASIGCWLIRTCGSVVLTADVGRFRCYRIRSRGCTCRRISSRGESLVVLFR